MADLIQKTDTLNDGREKLNKAIEHVDTFQRQIDEIVVEGDSSVEAAQARVDTKGNPHTTLKARLDAEQSEVASQLAERPTQREVNELLGNISEGTPLFADSVAGMTDTTRLYVNTTDGMLYAFDGTGFVSTGQQYQSTGIADSTVTGEKTNFLKYRNLFNPATRTTGKLLIEGTGAVSTNAAYDTSDYIPVKRGYITINFTRRVAVYDNSYKFVVDYNVTPPTSKTIFIENGGFIRTSFASQYVDTVMVEEGNQVSEYMPYGTNIPNDNFKIEEGNLTGNAKRKIENFESNGNLVNPSKIVDGLLLNNATGATSSNASYSVTDYIPVDVGNIGINTARKIALYDENLTFVKGYDVSPPSPIIVTADIKGYMRVGISTATKGYLTVKAGDKIPPYLPYGGYQLNNKVIVQEDNLDEFLKLKIFNRLYGKKGVYFGDSIVEAYGFNDGFAKIIANNNSGSYINNGIGGSTIGRRSGKTDSILEKINASTDVGDYYILTGGVNDSHNQQVPLGEISDGYDATLDEYTYCGALESALKIALTKWHGKKIGFVLNHNMPTRPYLKDYYEKARLICEKWSVPYLDLFNESGMNTHLPIIKDTYTKDNGSGGGDGTHPNSLGYEVYYAPKMEAWMKSM